MFKFLHKLADRMQLLGMQQNEIARVDGISLATIRLKQKQVFQKTLEESLRLIRKHDPRRYARLIKHFRWIFNSPLRKGMEAMFCSSTQSCVIDFHWLPGADHDLMAAFYACILVHESTHAIIESRGIQYRGEERRRIEGLCFAEQNRFAARLSAAEPDKYPARLLHINFDDTFWKSFYLGRVTRGMSKLSRLVAKAKAERAACSEPRGSGSVSGRASEARGR